MYQHGKKVHRQRNYMVLLATVGIVGVATIIGWLIIHKDVNSSTGPKTTAPIVTTVQASDTTDNITITDSGFTFQLPKDWKQTSKQLDTRYRIWEWGSTKKGADDRKIRLYQDIMPEDPAILAINKLLPLTGNNDSFLVGTLSDDCVNFAGNTPANKSGSSPFPAKWQGINFSCDPITNNQTIGTGSAAGGVATKLVSPSGQAHSYYILLIDHNIRPDSSILTNMLNSFKAK